ncbi:MAG: protein kinase, partial [Oscillospiraceae bacterium]|nr:protein kinase [Oscillospiraceae bacterium]
NLMKLISDCENIVDYKDCEIKSLKELGDFGWAIFIRLELLECFETKAAKGLTVSEILKFGIDICKALEICEMHQIIHRDMKHANLFYEPKTDTYKLGDFGISRFITEPTELKGIPGMLTHMPPEVYQSRIYTCSADQYALGIIIYRFLNQNRIPLLPPYPIPYSMKDREAALAKRLSGCEIGAPSISIFENKEFNEEDLMLFSERGAKLDKKSLPAAIAIGKIAQKEISPDPQKRFASATDFRCALEKVKENFDINV